MTTYHRLGALRNRNLSPPSSRNQKSKVKVGKPTPSKAERGNLVLSPWLVDSRLPPVSSRHLPSVSPHPSAPFLQMLGFLFQHEEGFSNLEKGFV